MYSTDRFLYKIWVGWFLTVIVSFLVFGVGPKPLAIPVVLVSFITFFWCIKCAFRSERFSDYASFRLHSSLILGPLLAFLALLTSTYRLKGLHWAPSVAISILPFLLFGLIYAFVYSAKSKVDVFSLVKDRVAVQEPPQINPWFLAGLGAGLGGLIFRLVQDPSMLIDGIFILAAACSLYSMFYFRAHIVSLKALKQLEKREQRHYTFHDIEHIRKLRQASFLGRLFAVKNKH